MASPAEIAQVLPDTLPEDFGEWDSGDSPSTRVDHNGTESAPGFGAVPKPPAQPAEQQVAVASVTEKVRNAPSSATATVRAEDQAHLRRLRSVNNMVDRLPGTFSPRQAASASAVDEAAFPPLRSNGAPMNGSRRTPMVEVAAMSEADEVLFQSFRPNSAVTADRKPARKKWMMVAAVSGGSVLLLLILMISSINRGRSPLVKPSVEAQSVATDAQTDATTLKPSPSTLTHSTPEKHPAAADAQDESADTQPASDQDAASPSQVQSQMMNDQLTAPARIPHNLNTQAVEEAPPSAAFGAAGMEGLSGNPAMGNVFNGQNRPKVQAARPKVVNISAGVAVGLLIQKTTPVYPLIAKTARVSGAVVLQATISKTGTIENLHVVSGPVMLRQAAVDAVRTWRYKPYKLNNEPTETETTINVIFSLVG